MQRRDLIKTGAAVVAAAHLPMVRAQSGGGATFTILSHKVHENVSRGLVAGTSGGDIAGEWAGRHNVKLNWVSADIDPMHDRLMREMSLRETSIDLALVINKYATPRLSALVEPLDPWLAREPIEDMAGIPANLISGLRTNEGALFAMPFRHATTGLHYNETLLKERGITRAPRSLDELLETARKVAHTRADGQKVYGLTVPAAAGPFAVLSFLNAFGAELTDQKLQVRANSPQMVRGLRTMNQLYKEGVLPPNYATLSIDEVITQMQTGQSAMCFDPFARFTTFNDPSKSRYPGQIKVVPIPADEGRIVAMTEVWAFVIPKGSKNKQLAWSLVRELSSPASTVRAALNGNGPVRPAAYNDARLQQRLPYTKEEAQAIANARLLPSNYNAAAQAGAVFMEESQAAVIGLKTPEQAAAEMEKRLAPLVRPRA